LLLALLRRDGGDEEREGKFYRFDYKLGLVWLAQPFFGVAVRCDFGDLLVERFGDH
jgi:hypothetical protein